MRPNREGDTKRGDRQGQTVASPFFYRNGVPGPSLRPAVPAPAALPFLILLPLILLPALLRRRLRSPLLPRSLFLDLRRLTVLSRSPFPRLLRWPLLARLPLFRLLPSLVLTRRSPFLDLRPLVVRL